ncbi:PAS domain S-box protein [Belliella aquatica]|nr:PAS domain S-box protein [Belliella aquatica]MCH7407132.1 PAS domain S-box protein [Belliella aquatica]
MNENKYSSLLLDQVKDLAWVVDSNLLLVYGNKAYFNVINEVTGTDKALHTSVLTEGFGYGLIDKWKNYYLRALSGENFEVEEDFYNPVDKKLQYSRISLSPIFDNHGKVETIICRSTDITPSLDPKDHASSLMNASQDVLCTIDTAGKFLFVSAASLDHWGYTSEELIGMPFKDLLIKEDYEKINQIVDETSKEKEFKSIPIRLNRKTGGIAYSSWSTTWNRESKLIYCVVRNIKEQIEQETEKELLRQISLSFNTEEDLIPAANGLCENLYKFGSFDLIELWCPNMEQTQLKLVGHSKHSQSFFEIEPLETTFKKNEGLPGKVWSKGKQILWNGDQIDQFFIRKKGASHLGLQALIGMPLTFNNELVGVLLIGTKRDEKYLNQLCSVLKGLDNFIGSEIHRKRLENNLRNVFDSTPEILCITDFKGRFLKMNNAGYALLGYSKDEVLFHTLDDFSIKEDQGEFVKKVKKISNDDPVFNFENRFLSKDGQLIWLNWNCNPILEEGLVYAAAKNITAEVKLRELNSQAGSLAKIGSWEVNLEQKTVFWSKIVHQLHETDPDTFIPDLALGINFYRKDFRPLVSKSIDACIHTGEGFDFEAVIITQKLKEKWVRSIGNVEIVEGIPKRIFGSFQDITDRKQSEIRLQTLSDDLPGVTFQYVITPDGKNFMQSVSKASIKIWRLSADKCEKDNNQVWEQIIKGGDYEKVQQSIEASIKTRNKWHFRWRNILPNGDKRWHEGFGTPNYLPNGTVIFNSMIFDITDEKLAIDLYEEASELAKIGNWELNLRNQNETDNMYWSPMLKNIMEVNDDYNPSLTGGFEFYEEESKALIQKSVEQLIESGKSFDLGLLIQTAKGNSKWIRCIGNAEFLEGKCQRIYGSFQDIHDLKTAELQLKTLTDNLPGVIFQYLMHPNGEDQILYISEGSYKVWGLSPEECKNSPEKIWQQIKAGGNQAELINSIIESSLNLTPWHSEWKNVSLDQSVKWYEGRGLPQRLPDGAILWNSLIIDITEKKAFESKFQEASVEMMTILESISDAFYAIDLEWNFTYFNKEAENLLKKKADEVLGGNIWEIFEPAKGTVLEEVYRRVALTGKSESFEYYYPGDCCWYDITTYPSSGGISIYFKNIDERRNAAENLEKAYREKNQILESIGDAFFAVDEEWIITYWNKQAETVMGKNKETVIGKNIWKVYPDAIDSDFYKQYHKAMFSGEIINFEEHYTALDMWIEVTVYPSGNGLSIYFKDITLRKKADIRLVQANDRFELVTKATNDAIWDWDIKNDNFYRSNNIYKILGHSASTKLKESQFWQDSFHPEDVAALKKSLEITLKDPQSERWTMEYRVYNEHQEERFIIDRGIIVRNKNGEAIRMVGAMTDLTEQKKLEKDLFQLSKSLKNYAKELERSNEELEQFAFITSHDLQEPLRMISSFMDQLKRNYSNKLDNKALQYIHFATDGAKRMKQIILDLLLYSRANKPSEQIEEVDLNEIINEYTQLRRKLIAEKKAIIKFEVLPKLNINRAPITQAIHCLLDNALKYSKQNVSPEIEIDVEEKETVWEFTIKDNGIGIDKKFHEKIFVIFQRLHNRKENDGTGIGLSIAKRSIEFLGGKIWLISEVGIGTTFYFTIAKTKNQI